MELLAPPLEPINKGLHKAPHQCQPLPITYTNDPSVVKEWMETHVVGSSQTSPMVLGMDTEAVPQFRGRLVPAALREIAVAQWATPTHALVVQACKATGRPSRACERILKPVVASNHIIKAGCGIDDDLMRLAKRWWPRDGQLQAPNRLDLGGVSAVPGQASGLKRIAATVLGLKLPKPRRITTSNWGQVPLTSHQIMYAARDAWVAAAAVETLSQVQPELFRVEALQASLQARELPLQDLMRRCETRQTAQQLIPSIRRATKAGHLDPFEARRHLKTLEQVLHETPPLHPEYFPFFEATVDVNVAAPETLSNSYNQTHILL